MLYNENMTKRNHTTRSHTCCPRHALRPDLYAAPCDFDGTVLTYVHPSVTQAVDLLDQAIQDYKLAQDYAGRHGL
jgi:hypothetical protein